MGRLPVLANTRQKTLKRINALLKDVERNKFTVQILLERYAYSEIVGTFILI